MFHLNKKGRLLAGVNALLITTVVIAAILFFLFFATKIFLEEAEDVERSVDFAVAEEQMRQSFITFLGSSVVVSGVEMQMTDLIRLSKISASYKEVLKKEVEKVFSRFYPEGFGFSIDGEEVVTLVKPKGLFNKQLGEYGTIPGFEVSEEIKIGGEIVVEMRIFEKQ